ncbi:hypothetical protein SK3146_01930 [Paenibacillus konkukensis]|uniref:Uncharacterized protein n=1 Tax=Paenibacillus konkukensis TaxID=2020716 RepID=A0ABY4RKT1_9BACL|nr:hypothetical protein SK3146_01930 [Paenibacillus konkukensis]
MTASPGLQGAIPRQVLPSDNEPNGTKKSRFSRYSIKERPGMRDFLLTFQMNLV